MKNIVKSLMLVVAFAMISQNSLIATPRDKLKTSLGLETEQSVSDWLSEHSNKYTIDKNAFNKVINAFEEKKAIFQKEQWAKDATTIIEKFTKNALLQKFPENLEEIYDAQSFLNRAGKTDTANKAEEAMKNITTDNVLAVIKSINSVKDIKKAESTISALKEFIPNLIAQIEPGNYVYDENLKKIGVIESALESYTKTKNALDDESIAELKGVIFEEHADKEFKGLNKNAAITAMKISDMANIKKGWLGIKLPEGFKQKYDKVLEELGAGKARTAVPAEPVPVTPKPAAQPKPTIEEKPTEAQLKIEQLKQELKNTKGKLSNLWDEIGSTMEGIPFPSTEEQEEQESKLQSKIVELYNEIAKLEGRGNLLSFIKNSVTPTTGTVLFQILKSQPAQNLIRNVYDKTPLKNIVTQSTLTTIYEKGLDAIKLSMFLDLLGFTDQLTIIKNLSSKFKMDLPNITVKSFITKAGLAEQWKYANNHQKTLLSLGAVITVVTLDKFLTGQKVVGTGLKIYETITKDSIDNFKDYVKEKLYINKINSIFSDINSIPKNMIVKMIGNIPYVNTMVTDSAIEQVIDRGIEYITIKQLFTILGQEQKYSNFENILKFYAIPPTMKIGVLLKSVGWDWILQPITSKAWQAVGKPTVKFTKKHQTALIITAAITIVTLAVITYYLTVPGARFIGKPVQWIRSVWGWLRGSQVTTAEKTLKAAETAIIEARHAERLAYSRKLYAWSYSKEFSKSSGLLYDAQKLKETDIEKAIELASELIPLANTAKSIAYAHKAINDAKSKIMAQPKQKHKEDFYQYNYYARTLLQTAEEKQKKAKQLAKEKQFDDAILTSVEAKRLGDEAIEAVDNSEAALAAITKAREKETETLSEITKQENLGRNVTLARNLVKNATIKFKKARDSKNPVEIIKLANDAITQFLNAQATAKVNPETVIAIKKANTSIESAENSLVNAEKINIPANKLKEKLQKIKKELQSKIKTGDQKSIKDRAEHAKSVADSIDKAANNLIAAQKMINAAKKSINKVDKNVDTQELQKNLNSIQDRLLSSSKLMASISVADAAEQGKKAAKAIKVTAENLQTTYITNLGLAEISISSAREKLTAAQLQINKATEEKIHISDIKSNFTSATTDFNKAVEKKESDPVQAKELTNEAIKKSDQIIKEIIKLLPEKKIKEEEEEIEPVVTRWQQILYGATGGLAGKLP